RGWGARSWLALSEVRVVSAASTSLSPAKVPPTIATVALARVRLSESETLAAPASVTAAPFWVNVAPVTPARFGGLLTAVTETVVVWTVLRLLERLPASATPGMVRLGVGPKVGGVFADG